MSGVIDTVVLDFGGVLVQWDPLHHPTLPPERVAEHIAATDFHALNLRADAGETWAALAREVAGAHPDRPELAAFLAGYPDVFPHTLVGLVPGMADVVEDLRSAGLRVLGLTNWSAETYPHGVAFAPAISRLEGIVVSGEVGLAKPDPAIFALLCRRYGLVAQRTLFVDDNAANIAAADGLGFHTYHFGDAAGLRARLAQLTG